MLLGMPKGTGEIDDIRNAATMGQKTIGKDEARRETQHPGTAFNGCSPPLPAADQPAQPERHGDVVRVPGGAGKRRVGGQRGSELRRRRTDAPTALLAGTT